MTSKAAPSTPVLSDPDLAAARGVGPGLLRVRAVAAGVAGLVTALVYAPLAGADFVDWDDNWLVYANPHLQGLGWTAIKEIFDNTNASGLIAYTPLAGLRYAVIHELAGLAPGAYHLANLLFHALAAALVALLLFELLRLRPSSARPALLGAAACAGALLWALHPLRVEPVAWVAAGPHGQALFFSLLSVLLFVRATRTAPAKVGTLMGSLASYAVALFSHPTAIGVVGALLAIEHFTRYGAADKEAQPGWGPRMARLLPFVALAAVCLALNKVFVPPSPATPMSVGSLMKSPYLLTYYLWRHAAPFGLSPLYSYLLDFRPLSLEALVSGFAALGMAAALAASPRARPAPFALLLAYVGLLSPALLNPIFPHDRYVLAASLVLSVPVAAWLASEGAKRLGFRFGAVLVVASSLAGLTASQQAVWRNSATLFTRMIDRIEDASGSEALRLQAQTRHRLATAFAAQGRHPEALGEIERAIALAPEDPALHNTLLRLCQAAGPGRREACFLEHAPSGPAGQPRLGLARSLALTLDWAGAVRVYRELVEEAPSNSPLRLEYASLLIARGRLQEAKAMLEAVASDTPGLKSAHEALARQEAASRPREPR